MDNVSEAQSGSLAVAPAADTGLIALCLIARHLGVPANPAILGRHHLVAGTIASKEDLIRIARRLGLRGRLVTTKWDRLAKTPLPAILLNTDGQFSIISRVIDGRAAVHSPGAARPHLLERSEFEAAWTGEVILLTKRSHPRRWPTVSIYDGFYRPYIATGMCSARSWSHPSSYSFSVWCRHCSSRSWWTRCWCIVAFRRSTC